MPLLVDWQWMRRGEGEDEAFSFVTTVSLTIIILDIGINTCGEAVKGPSMALSLIRRSVSESCFVGVNEEKRWHRDQFK
jgi:hypothetical protein